jgi:hypothetical protein
MDSYVDDTGDGQSGTIIDAAFLDSIADDITAVQTASNDVLAEVIDARGNLPSLDARLDQAMDEDGNIRQEAVQGLVGIASGLNLVGNDTFLCWPNGDALAPAYYVLSGVGAAVARTGSGLADTNRKWGRYAARLTSGAAASGVLTQTLVGGTDIAFATALAGKRLAFGCRVRCLSAGVARVTVHDGVSTGASEYHSGQTTTGPELDGWEWLTGIHTISSGPSILNIICQVDPSGGAIDAWFSGLTVVFDEITLGDWKPALVTRKQFVTGAAAGGILIGNATTGQKAYFSVDRPAVVRAVQLVCNTAPTGAALIVDVNSRDSVGNYTSMFAGSGTQPTIAIGAFAGGVLPDGTFARRCLTTQFGASILEGGVIRVDVDQVGSGTAGADVSITIMYESWNRPLDELLLS